MIKISAQACHLHERGLIDGDLCAALCRKPEAVRVGDCRAAHFVKAAVVEAELGGEKVGCSLSVSNTSQAGDFLDKFYLHKKSSFFSPMQRQKIFR